VDSGIRRVVASIGDPNPVVCGRGFALLREHGVEVTVGVRSTEAARLNQPFFTLMRCGRPFVILKAATSLDGCIAETPGVRTFLTSAEADRHAHAFRAEVDAIGVGIGTVLADDPLLTVRGVYRARPLTRVVFDRNLRTPPDARLLSTRASGPVIIVTTAAAAARRDLMRPLEDRGAEIEVARDDSFSSALEPLARRSISSLMLEGGTEMHLAAWDARQVDVVSLYVTPKVLGPGGLRFLPGRRFATSELIDARVEPLGPDVLIEGYVHRLD
jgi:diaminohydroxyphosphoribosylaminopyrimidine deaminase/5-amino-6-(5-phosphoribosylamino)uracil reductase